MNLINVVANKVDNGFILEINRVDPISTKQSRTIEVYKTRDEILNRVAELI